MASQQQQHNPSTTTTTSCISTSRYTSASQPPPTTTTNLNNNNPPTNSSSNWNYTTNTTVTTATSTSPSDNNNDRRHTSPLPIADDHHDDQDGNVEINPISLTSLSPSSSATSLSSFAFSSSSVAGTSSSAVALVGLSPLPPLPRRRHPLQRPSLPPHAYTTRCHSSRVPRRPMPSSTSSSSTIAPSSPPASSSLPTSPTSSSLLLSPPAADNHQHSYCGSTSSATVNSSSAKSSSRRQPPSSHQQRQQQQQRQKQQQQRSTPLTAPVVSPSRPPLAPPSSSGGIKLWASLRRLWNTILPPSASSGNVAALPPPPATTSSERSTSPSSNPRSTPIAQCQDAVPPTPVVVPSSSSSSSSGASALSSHPLPLIPSSSSRTTPTRPSSPLPPRPSVIPLQPPPITISSSTPIKHHPHFSLNQEHSPISRCSPSPPPSISSSSSPLHVVRRRRVSHRQQLQYLREQQEKTLFPSSATASPRTSIDKGQLRRSASASVDSATQVDIPRSSSLNNLRFAPPSSKALPPTTSTRQFKKPYAQASATTSPGQQGESMPRSGSVHALSIGGRGVVGLTLGSSGAGGRMRFMLKKEKHSYLSGTSTTTSTAVVGSTAVEGERGFLQSGKVDAGVDNGSRTSTSGVTSSSTVSGNVVTVGGLSSSTKESSPGLSTAGNESNINNSKLQHPEKEVQLLDTGSADTVTRHLTLKLKSHQREPEAAEQRSSPSSPITSSHASGAPIDKQIQSVPDDESTSACTAISTSNTATCTSLSSSKEQQPLELAQDGNVNSGHTKPTTWTTETSATTTTSVATTSSTSAEDTDETVSHSATSVADTGAAPVVDSSATLCPLAPPTSPPMPAVTVASASTSATATAHRDNMSTTASKPQTEQQLPRNDEGDGKKTCGEAAIIATAAVVPVADAARLEREAEQATKQLNKVSALPSPPSMSRLRMGKPNKASTTSKLPSHPRSPHARIAPPSGIPSGTATVPGTSSTTATTKQGSAGRQQPSQSQPQQQACTVATTATTSTAGMSQRKIARPRKRGVVDNHHHHSQPQSQTTTSTVRYRASTTTSTATTGKSEQQQQLRAKPTGLPSPSRGSSLLPLRSKRTTAQQTPIPTIAGAPTPTTSSTSMYHISAAAPSSPGSTSRLLRLSPVRTGHSNDGSLAAAILASTTGKNRGSTAGTGPIVGSKGNVNSQSVLPSSPKPAHARLGNRQVVERGHRQQQQQRQGQGCASPGSKLPSAMSSGQVRETVRSAQLRAAKRLSAGRSSVVATISATSGSGGVKNEAGDREKSGNPRNRNMTLTMTKNSKQKKKLNSSSGNLKNVSNHKTGNRTAPNLHRPSGTMGGDAGRQQPFAAPKQSKGKGPSAWTSSPSPTADEDQNQQEECEGRLNKKGGHGNDRQFTESQQQQEEKRYQLEELKQIGRTEQKKDDVDDPELLQMFTSVPSVVINIPPLVIPSLPSSSSSSFSSVSGTPSQVPTPAAHPSSSSSPPPMGDMKEAPAVPALLSSSVLATSPTSAPPPSGMAKIIARRREAMDIHREHELMMKRFASPQPGVHQHYDSHPLKLETQTTNEGEEEKGDSGNYGSGIDDAFEIEVDEQDLSPNVLPCADDLQTLQSIRPASYLLHMIAQKPTSVLSAPGSPRGGGFFVGFPMDSHSRAHGNYPSNPLPFDLDENDIVTDKNDMLFDTGDVPPDTTTEMSNVPSLTLPENLTQGSPPLTPPLTPPGMVRHTAPASNNGNSFTPRRRNPFATFTRTRRASVSMPGALMSARDRYSWTGFRRQLSVDKLNAKKRLTQLQMLVTQLRVRQATKNAGPGVEPVVATFGPRLPDLHPEQQQSTRFPTMRRSSLVSWRSSFARTAPVE